MQKVITVSLSGNAYQLDEPGYEALRAYLHLVEAKLGDDSDRREVTRDLEQSISEKCARYLGPGKTVISTEEVEQILREIGPVDGEPVHGVPPASAPPPPTAPKRLYQIREGAMISGICNGIAAYWHVDPTIIRVVSVIGGVVEMIVTDDPPWMAVTLYAALVFLVPYAESPEGVEAGKGHYESIPDRVHATVEKVKATFSRRPTVGSR
jgi:phage shock protein PspC (stress-responsive transcriptional regulator)